MTWALLLMGCAALAYWGGLRDGRRASRREVSLALAALEHARQRTAAMVEQLREIERRSHGERRDEPDAADAWKPEGWRLEP